MKYDNRFSRTAIAIAGIATFLSGAAGLSYEVVWSRMLVVPLGNSSDATTAVLCAFMFGMAAGSRSLGALADRIASPLRIYIAAELLLAAYAVLVPFFIPALESSTLLAGSFATRPFSAGARMFAVFTLIATPAFLMGGAIPVLVRALGVHYRFSDMRIGFFYGLNTLGGAAGAALAGFIAIPALGLSATSIGAAAITIVAALLVAGVHSLQSKPNTDKSTTAGLVQEIPDSGIRTAAWIVAGVGGFVMLGLEVLHARVLTFVFGHDTYAFAMLLVTVLSGLGIGGVIHRVTSAYHTRGTGVTALSLMSVTALLSFLCAALLVITSGRDPFAIGAREALSTSLWLEFAREVVYTPILVLIPSIMAGISLPSACALCAGPAQTSGKRIGNALLINGIGAALGTVVTSIILIPKIGIQGSFIVLSLLGSVGAFIAVLFINIPDSAGKLRLMGTALSVLFLTAAISVFMPAALPRAMLHEAVGVKHQKIIHYEEGRTGTVSVTRNLINDERQLFMNAVNEVTTRLVHDQSFKMLGHLGPLLVPSPRNGLMICFGAGLSAGSALVHPFQKLDVVDLSETIPRAADHFSLWNNDPLKDSRLKLHIEDGRQFLLRSEEKFDVVMVDSTHPKAVDSWILYTVEFYRLTRKHLAKDGALVQWLPLHGLSEMEFKIIVQSFLEVYPNMTMWLNVGYETYGQAAYAKLVGTVEPLTIDYQELSRRLAEPAIKADLAPYGMDSPEEILDMFVADAAHVRSFVSSVPTQRDNQPFLPYITGYSRGRRMEAKNLVSMRTSVRPLLYNMGPDEPRITETLHKAFEATGFLMADELAQAAAIWPTGKKIKLFEKRAAASRKYYLQLAVLYANDPGKLFETANYLGNLGHLTDAIPLYRKALQMSSADNRIRINLALALFDSNQIDKARPLFEDALRLENNNALVLYNVGVFRLSQGDAAGAIELFERALVINNDLYNAHISLADAWLRMGQLPKAEKILRHLIGRADWLAEPWDMLGLVESARKNYERAREYHMRALERDPYRATSHYNMGLALMALKRYQEAAAAFMAAIRISPDDAEAHNNLGLVFGSFRAYDKAVFHHLRALEINPDYFEAAFNLGLAYKEQGKKQLAAEAFALALQLAPNLEQAREQLASMGISRVEITESQMDTDSSMQLSPGDPDTSIEKAPEDTGASSSKVETAPEPSVSPASTSSATEPSPFVEIEAHPSAVVSDTGQ